MREAVTVLSEEEELFRETLRDFADQEVAPGAIERDQKGRIEPELVSKLFELGAMSVEVPERFGGAGGSFFLTCLAIEEISRADASVGAMVDVQNTIVAGAILGWGTEAQQEEFLTKLASGSIGSYALSESASGSDAFALETRAVADGDGYRLTGRKLWITNAAESEIFVVFATVDPSAGHRGISCFLVERGFEGFEVGKKEDKLGQRASSTCELILDGVPVPRKNVLGEVGQGYKVAIETLNEGRIGIGAQMLGLARGSFDAALAYTGEREQFGQKIGSFQSVQFELARMATDLEISRLLVYNSARLRDAKRPFLKEAAMAKLVVCDMAERVSSMAIELFGGVGITTEYPVEKRYRDAKPARVYEGTAHMQLMTIARQIQRGT